MKDIPRCEIELLKEMDFLEAKGRLRIDILSRSLQGALLLPKKAIHPRTVALL